MTQGVVASIFAQETRLRQMVDALQVKRIDEFSPSNFEFRVRTYIRGKHGRIDQGTKYGG